MKCQMNTCNKKTKLHGLGFCKYCSKEFCDLHWIMEDHKCENIDDFINQKKDLMKKTLTESKCVGNKVIFI